MNLLAFDPGVRYPAIAVSKDGVIVRALRVPLPATLKKLDPGERTRRIAILAADLAKRICTRIDHVVYELPQIYTASKSKGDPNNLVLIALTAANLTGILNVPCTAVHPRMWLSGNTPKSEDGDPWASPRGIRVKKTLRPNEFAAIESTHDAVDAVGILLWKLGRFGITRVLPGAV